MKKITLTNQATIAGYEGAFLRKGDSAEGLWNNWYEASATDEDGNTYTVYWAITGDINDEDASDHCDWDTPYMVTDEDGHIVKEAIEIC